MSKNTYRKPSSARNAREREQERAVRRRMDSIRGTADDDYDEESYEWQERETSRKARNGCLIAFLVVLLIILGAVVVGALYVKGEIDGKNATATEPVVLDVVSGYGGRTMGKILEEKGLIGNATIFRFYVQFKGVGNNFIAGRHSVTPGMSYDEIIITLSKAPPPRETVDVRIPEGVSIMKVADLFEQAGLCTAKEFLQEADFGDFSDIRLIQELDKDYNPDVFHRAEGYLYPDTYSFFKDETVHNIVRKLYEEMDKKITDEMYVRMEELGLSLRQTITLASLIQAEASQVEQQPTVSGVFWNRLSEKWQQEDGTMGSDVTIRYIKIYMQWTMPEYSEKTYMEISYDEARAAVGDTLFYAYLTDIAYPGTRRGLPTGPICSVSSTAVSAALNPEAHGYYYFVTDAYANFYYAETLAEHNRNIATADKMNLKFEKEQAEKAAQEGSGAASTQETSFLIFVKQEEGLPARFAKMRWGIPVGAKAA